MQNLALNIHDMEQRHWGLTRATAEYLTEGARVCLDRHHQPPVGFQIRWAERNAEALVEWEQTDDRTRGAWANRIDTTEAGAYACVLAAVELLAGLVAVRRAEQLTGADYYVAPPGASSDDFESMIRLEVAGRDMASVSGIASLLECKLQQAASGDSNLPAIAGVVGFRVRLIHLANLEEL